MTKHKAPRHLKEPVCDTALILAAPELLATADAVAAWLCERADHYQQLGSHDVANGLIVQADKLYAIIAQAKGQS